MRRWLGGIATSRRGDGDVAKGVQDVAIWQSNDAAFECNETGIPRVGRFRRAKNGSWSRLRGQGSWNVAIGGADVAIGSDDVGSARRYRRPPNRRLGVVIVSGGGFAVGTVVGVGVGTGTGVGVGVGPCTGVGVPFGVPFPFGFPPLFDAPFAPASSGFASPSPSLPASSRSSSRSLFSCPGNRGFHASVEWHSPHVVGNFPACPGAFAYSASWQAKHSFFVPAKTGGSPLWQSKQRVVSCFPVSAHHS